MKHDFTSHDLHLPELTLRGMLLGALITVIFTASNVYLGLKVGLTFSSSIPAAIISMAILRFSRILTFLKITWYKRRLLPLVHCPLLSLSCQVYSCLGIGMGFPFWQTFLLCACSGSLGVLFTIMRSCHGSE